jgi:hypothetical protein
MTRDRGAMSGALAGVAFLGGLGGGVAVSKEPYPRPGVDAETIRRYFAQRPSPLRISGPGQLVSAAALARFTASVVRLAGRSGRGARALQTAAVAGGAVPSASLAAAAVTGIALAREPAGERAVARHRRLFTAGGPVHGAGFGLLVGALGVAGLRTGDLPRPLAIAGVAGAVPNLLSPLVMVREPAALLIPAGRFPGLVVCAIAGARLAGTFPRHEGGSRV